MTDAIARRLSDWAVDDAFSKSSPMCFITGPRQVGKTFLAHTQDAAYFNWDTAEAKKLYLRDPYFFRGPSNLVVFDEIHKRRDWKKLLKGYYDSPERRENFIVTGSGRFVFFQKSVDSLQGRYMVNQLWPLSYDEVVGKKCVRRTDPLGPRNFSEWEPSSIAQSDAELFDLGGVPQPFLRGSALFLRRWQDQYVTRSLTERRCS